MDKILSARVDDTVIHRIGMLAEQLHTTKKAIIEGAIIAYAEKVETEKKLDVLEQTLGAWQRDEAPDETVRRVRCSFRNSMQRRQK